ncbi:MAG TPA: dephospho-CoA kinase [Gemmataceae bacterium]|nr:dephospho-CoA kinase [Gemmataceae bacterium]
MTTAGHAKPVVGLVGGIGAGKSTVAAALARHGGRVVAGDPLGHEALEAPEIKPRILEVWGAREITTPDGRIDRKRLGRIVFPSPVERSRLEHLVHPYIGRRIREEIAKLEADSAVKFVILDAAVMLEAGWDGVCDKLVFVDAPREVRLARVQAQRGWTAADLANREAVQMPPEKKQERADAVVSNGGTPQDTSAQVDALVERWKLG